MARQFNTGGANNWYNITDTGLVSSGASFAAWLNYASTPSAYPNLFTFFMKAQSNIAQRHYWIIDTGSGPILDITVSGVAQELSISYTATHGQWFHLGISTNWTTAGTIIAINGASQTLSGSMTGPPDTTSVTTTLIGSSATSNQGEFNGQMADHAIWNTPLSINELNALAQGMRPGSIRQENLISWIPFQGLVANEVNFADNTFSGGLQTVPNGTNTVTNDPWLQPLITSMYSQGTMPSSFTGGAASTAFRKTLSGIGGRIASRQTQGWGN